MRNAEHLDFAGRLAVALHDHMPGCDIRLSNWSGIEIICGHGGHKVSQVFQIHELKKLGLDAAVEKIVRLTGELEGANL